MHWSKIVTKLCQSISIRLPFNFKSIINIGDLFSDKSFLTISLGRSSPPPLNPAVENPTCTLSADTGKNESLKTGAIDHSSWKRHKIPTHVRSFVQSWLPSGWMRITKPQLQCSSTAGALLVCRRLLAGPRQSDIRVVVDYMRKQ